MQLKLRTYQVDLKDAIISEFLKSNKRVLVQSPTGSGKTLTFSHIANEAQKKGNRVLIITDRTELLTQTGGTLATFGMKPFLIRPGIKFVNRQSSVFVAMAMTLRNRLKESTWLDWFRNEVDIVIIDEAHIQTTNYLFENECFSERQYVLGFTATPKRTGGMRQLGLDYEALVEGVSVRKLIELGYLVNDDYHGVNGANLNHMKFNKMKGDFDEKDMFNRFNNTQLYTGVVKNWTQIAPNSLTVVFCVNIEHVIKTCLEFRKNGIAARFLTSSVSKPRKPKEDADEGVKVRYEERMKIYELYERYFDELSGKRDDVVGAFKRKEFAVLVNAGILTTGFDCPDIETVIVNRATTSMALWLQMIGRGSRPAKNKDSFNILDFGENAARLGHYTAPQAWSLWHETKTSDDVGVPPTKFCGEDTNGKDLAKDKNGRVGCHRMILASYGICPFCGYMSPEKQAKEVDLTGIVYDESKHRAVAVKKVSDMSVKELIEYREIKKHRMPWLWRQLMHRGGEQLIEKTGIEHGWKRGTIEKAKQYVRNLR